METWWQDTRFAIRMLLKNPGFTAVAVTVLALGIGANTAIFSVVKAILLNALPYHQPEQLVTLAATDSSTLNPTNVSYLLVQDWKQRSHSFQSIAIYRDWAPLLAGQGKPRMLSGLRVSADFLDTLGVAPALGRHFSADEDRPDRWRVVLLAHGFWKEQFGGRPDIVGQTLHLSQTPYLIAGVLPENFRPLIFSSDAQALQIVAPLGYDASLPDACRDCQHLRSVARLAEGVRVEQAQAEMDAISPALAREFPQNYPSDFGAVVVPLRDRVVGRVREALWLLMGATGFVLLIACANAGNLLLSRATARRREMAVRAALGARWGRLALQWLTETTLLTLLGGAAGVLLAFWGVSTAVNWAPTQIPRLDEIRLDLGALLFALGLSLVTGIVVGLLPAMQAARADQREALRQGGRGSIGSSSRRFRHALIVTQVALAFVLTAGTGLLLKSLVNVLGVNPGFDSRNLHTANLALVGPKWSEDAPVVEFERQALERIRAVPGIDAAAMVSTLPLGGGFDRRGFHIQDRRLASESEAPSVDAYYVSSDYFRTMGIPVFRGRVFDEADMANSSAPVAVISQSTAQQMWPEEDPLGKRIQLGGREEDKPWAAIVGIVGDVRQYGLDAKPTADAYLPYTSNVLSFPVLVIRSGLAPVPLRRAVEEQIAMLDREVPIFAHASMEKVIATSITQRRFVATMVGGFGFLALALAALGLYGVLAYQVAEHTAETGIRMALGASRGAVFRLFTLEGLRATAVGLALGTPAALGLTRVMASQLFEVRASDPNVLALAAVILAGSALAASYVPARRAARTDPMVALRYE